MKHNVTSSVKIVTVWWRKLTHVVLLPCYQFLHVSIDYKCEGIILLPNRKVSGPSGRSPAEIVGSNPTGGHGWLSVVSVVLSGRGLCDELITRPEESYRLWCVVVCELEASWMRRSWPTGGLLPQKQKQQSQSYGLGGIPNSLISNRTPECRAL